MQNSTDHDELLFSNTSPVSAHDQMDDDISANAYPWKIMIVDDDEVIHDVSHLVLSDLSFAGRAIKIIDSYSAKEAIESIKQHPDIALVFLDVVMETDQAGLEVVKFVRESLNNHLMRIILRTGQPGCAPEEEIIQNYDINDYKEKTELTARKLHTSVITSLRDYISLKSAYDSHPENMLQDLVNRIKTLEKCTESLQEEIIVRKKLNDDLIKSEASLQLAQEVANVGHWEWNITENRYIYSDKAKRILGVSLSSPDASLDTLISHIPTAEQIRIKDLILHSIEEKTDFDIAHEIADDQGKTKRVHHVGRPFCDAEGNLLRFIGTLQDITP